MADHRKIDATRGASASRNDRDGAQPWELSPAELASALQDANSRQTREGPAAATAEREEAVEPGSDKRVVFPSRNEQIRRRDAEFCAKLERAYETVKITPLPAQSFGESRSDIEKPDVAADEVRVLLMRHFPDGPGMAAIAQKAAHRYNDALQKSLQKDNARRPKRSELARRWGLFCSEHAHAEEAYCQAGYRPALVNPYAIDFSDVTLTGRERKAAVRDRSTGRDRGHDMER